MSVFYNEADRARIASLESELAQARERVREARELLGALSTWGGDREYITHLQAKARRFLAKDTP